MQKSLECDHVTIWPPRKGARRTRLDAIRKGERPISEAAYLRLRVKAAPKKKGK